MSSRRSVRRLVVAVLLGVLVGGGLMAVTPAGAEVTQAAATSWKKIWKKQLRPLADKRYYTKDQSDTAFQPRGSYEPAGSGWTKAESDARYAGAGSSYTRTESDQKYVARRALLTGSWGFGGAVTNGYAMDSINYGAVLSAVPTVHFIAVGAVPPPQCPGTSAAPDAAAGHLCVYASSTPSISAPYVFDQRADSAMVTGQATAAGWAYGTWAVRPLGYAAAGAPAKSGQSTTGAGERPGS